MQPQSKTNSNGDRKGTASLSDSLTVMPLRLRTAPVIFLSLLSLLQLVPPAVAAVAGPRHTESQADHTDWASPWIFYLEGDVRHSIQEDAALDGAAGHTDKDRELNTGSHKWPNGVVPYTLQEDFPDWLTSLIQTAMNELESQVGRPLNRNGNKKQELPVRCVRFVPRSSEQYFLEIRDDGSCHATLGYNQRARMVLSVSAFCARMGTLRHQLLHVLGFGHEHARPDRDKFIHLDWSNMAEPSLFSLTQQGAQLHDVGLPYDFESVTHFGPYTGARNPRLPVMTPRSEYAADVRLGQTRGFSSTDVLRIQRLYGCVNDPHHEPRVRASRQAWLLACDFQHGPCGMTPGPGKGSRVGHYSHASGDDTKNNRGVGGEENTDTGSAEGSRTLRWTAVVGSTPDGPAAGRTNGLDPYLYVSSRLAGWADSGVVAVLESPREPGHSRLQQQSREGKRRLLHQGRRNNSNNPNSAQQVGSLSAGVAALLLSAGGPGVPLVNVSVFTPPFRPRHPEGKICVDFQVYQTDHYGGLTLVLHIAASNSSEAGSEVMEVKDEAVEVIEELHGIVLDGWTWTAVSVQAQQVRNHTLELRAAVGGGSVAVDDLYITDGECL